MMRKAPTAHTGNYARRVLRIALNRAVKRGDVHRNVAALTDNRRTERHKASFLTVEQARALLGSVVDDPHAALYAVALTMGLRQGEALGLLWDDANFDTRTLVIRHQLQRSRLGNGLVRVPTKTNQVRTLVMPRGVVDALKRHRTAQKEARLLAGSRWQDQGYVFTSSIGTPLDARNVVRRFHTALEGADLPSMRWHELRHSAASLALAQGATMKEVQTLLGHSQINVTMDFYTHVMPDALQGIADHMDKSLYFGTP